MDTPVGVPFKERIRNEREKLREMSFKKKREHIWEYYKVPIIGFVIFLIVLGSLINTWFINPPPKTALLVAWSGGFVIDEQSAALTDVLTGLIVDPSANEVVQISSFLTDGDPQLTMANINRLVAMLSVGEIDIFIMNEQVLEDYAGAEYLLPLGEIIERVRAESPAAYNNLIGNIIVRDYGLDSESKTQTPIGFDVSESPLLERLEFFRQELYLGVAVTSKKIDNVVIAIAALYE